MHDQTFARNHRSRGLAKAIEAEVKERGPGWEGRVAVLAGGLQARRLARKGVLAIEPRRRQRGP